MSKRDPCDRYEEISNRVRWARATCDVLVSGENNLDMCVVETIAGIGGHLDDALRELEELYGDLPERTVNKRKPPSAPTLVAVRKDTTADDNGSAA